jgi:hypothetical protein
VLTCPFCGAPETDRFEFEGQRFLVFRCLFTPKVDPAMSEEELARHLEAVYRDGTGGAFFRQMCDRLHLYVTQGDGARVLRRAGGRDRDAAQPPESPAD